MKVAGLRGQPGRGLEAGLAGAELEMESGPMFGSNSDIITQNTAHTIIIHSDHKADRDIVVHCFDFDADLNQDDVVSYSFPALNTVNI